ncbi:MAG: hypothetical protein HQ457_05095 [Betaproteobacteria bacterium]|nr:hypothetical protein [Betaproteobacteria bacterium]
MPLPRQENIDARQFSTNIVNLPSRMKFTAMYNNQHLGLSDEEDVLQIQENLYL